MKTQVAKLRHTRIAPRKMRLVADLLRGLTVNEAEAELMLQARRPARPLLKLLRSAVANAKNNQKLNPERLVIDSIRVDGGSMLKRFLPRARGSASEIQKKMSHVTIVLRESDSARPERYHITPPAAKRKAEEPKKPKLKKELGEAPSQEKGGKKKFWKRLFNRKAV